MNAGIMKCTQFTGLLAGALAFGIFAAKPSQAQSNGEILHEIQALRKSIDELKNEITLLKERPVPLTNPIHLTGGNSEALAKITYPDSGNKQALREYVRQIMAATKNQNSFSPYDEQVQMLAAVGSSNIDLLIEAMSFRSGINNTYHLIEALKLIVEPEHKDLILDRLLDHHELVEIVDDRGWAEDARDTLLIGLQSVGDYYPSEWIDCVVSFNDPTTYPLLEDYFVYGNNHSQTYESIRNLPDFDLDTAVAKMWKQAGSIRNDCDSSQTAIIAAEHGHFDALDSLIITLNNDPTDWEQKSIRKAIYHLTDYRGPISGISDWYNSHKASLEYDPEQRHYYSN